MKSIKEHFLSDGYVIIDVLTDKEIEDFREVMDTLISPKLEASNTKKKSSSFQHLGDEIADFGKEARQYYFHLLTKPGTEAIHHAFYHPVILKAVEEILGPNLIVNNASILAANIGTSYHLDGTAILFKYQKRRLRIGYFRRNDFTIAFRSICH